MLEEILDMPIVDEKDLDKMKNMDNKSMVSMRTFNEEDFREGYSQVAIVNDTHNLDHMTKQD